MGLSSAPALPFSGQVSKNIASSPTSVDMSTKVGDSGKVLGPHSSKKDRVNDWAV
jgi:hypothetical protein